MKQQNWVYLGQLVRALQLEAVDGKRIGELVAEIEQYLDESGMDPVDEFGPPAMLARELAQQPGSRRPGWVPPMWLTYLVVFVLLLIVVPLVAPWEWAETTIPVTRGAISYVVVFSTTVFWLGYAATLRLDGRTWRALTDWRFGLSVAAIAVLAALLFNTGSERAFVDVPKVPYLVFAGLVTPVLFVVLIRRNNPVRFPQHAQHLNRLKRGLLSGRAPVSRRDNPA